MSLIIFPVDTNVGFSGQRGRMKAGEKVELQILSFYLQCISGFFCGCYKQRNQLYHTEELLVL